MKIKIRKAKLDDIKTMQKFMYLLMQDEYEMFDPTNKITWAKSQACADYFEMRIENNNSYALIVEDNGKPIGYLSGEVRTAPKYRTLKKIGEIGDMFILEQYRNKKIGTKLIKEFIKWAKKRKAQKLMVHAFAHNNKALRFYRRHGFDDYTMILESKI
ncbi:GNAT family N-acetyltransferase [Patescibacteria group bacterium]